MKKTLSELASIVGGELVGDPAIIITGVGGITEARRGDIAFIANRKYFASLQTTQAGAVLVPLEVETAPRPIIRVKDPSLAFARLVGLFHPVPVRHPKGIHKKAVIAKTARIGKGVAIGAGTVIEDGVKIGDGTIIYSNCFVGCDTVIGRACLIYPHVSIRERVTVGNRVFIQSGTVIGSEGFGYVKVDGKYQLIPQIGTVAIEDDVEIGANVTIDRARFDKTVIGRGTKIDNLVQIAHNVVTGENCIIVAQAGVSGSTHLGNNVTLAGQAGLVGHIHIGDNAIVTAQAGVAKDVPPDTMVSGTPARPFFETQRTLATVQRLPEYVKILKELEKKIAELEKKIDSKG